jgi:hypothetical protein
VAGGIRRWGVSGCGFTRFYQRESSEHEVPAERPNLFIKVVDVRQRQTEYSTEDSSPHFGIEALKPCDERRFFAKETPPDRYPVTSA